MLWRQCCSVLSVWSRVLLALGRLSPLPPSSTTCPDKATGKKYLPLLKYLKKSLIFVIPATVFYTTVPVLTLCAVCMFADQFWCVRPVTLPWISWLRRLTRQDWRLSGFVPKAVRPSSHQCPSWLCTTRSATWTGQWHVGELTLDSKVIYTWLLLCTNTHVIASRQSTRIIVFVFLHLHLHPALSHWPQMSPCSLTHTYSCQHSWYFSYILCNWYLEDRSVEEGNLRSGMTNVCQQGQPNLLKWVIDWWFPQLRILSLKSCSRKQISLNARRLPPHDACILESLDQKFSTC